MRVLRLMPVMLLAACWKLDSPVVDTDRVAFAPVVGGPADWWVESFDMALSCPDGTPARFWLVYPDVADVRTHPGVGTIPTAVVYHSGAFDWVLAPTSASPFGTDTFQESLGLERRLDLDWSAQQVFATLGMYPSYDDAEISAGALPAALATKGIAMILPSNCWGDWWHNRSSVAENDFSADLFFRDGRTAAEFGWLHVHESFPPGNPVVLPINVDTDRIFVVGLGGEGSRAASELLTIRGGDGSFSYQAEAVVLDSPVDDLRVLYGAGVSADLQPLRDGFNRIFPGGNGTAAPPNMMVGAASVIPAGNLPNRLGLLVSSADPRIPDGANDALLQRFKDASTSVWAPARTEYQHVLSNSNVGLARAVADFLADGESGIDPSDLD